MSSGSGRTICSTGISNGVALTISREFCDVSETTNFHTRLVTDGFHIQKLFFCWEKSNYYGIGIDGRSYSLRA